MKKAKRGVRSFEGQRNKSDIARPDPQPSVCQYLGYNYRMTDIQAALGTSQLKRLDSFVERRRKIARLYHKAFKENPYFDIPYEEDYAYSSYHLYPIRLKDKYRDKKKMIFSKLREEGLGVQVHYIPVYW